MNETLRNMRSLPKPVVKTPLANLFQLIQIAFDGDFTSSTVHPVFHGEFEIEWKTPGDLSMTVVSRSNYDGRRGYYPSRKMGRPIEFASHFELSSMQIMEINGKVHSYQEQPLVVKYWDETGKLHVHYPDLLVNLTNGRKVVIEVKSNRYGRNAEFLARAILMQRIFHLQNIHYFMVTADQLECEFYLSNAIDLLNHSVVPYPEGIWEKTRRFFCGQPFSTLKEFKEHLGGREGKAWSYRLITEGYVACDLALELTDTSLLHWAKNVDKQ